jgi:hypothetical protein
LGERDLRLRHRVAAIIDRRGGLRLISCRGRDRTRLLGAPFRELAAIGREIVLDGEVAVPNDRGVTQVLGKCRCRRIALLLKAGESLAAEFVES